MSAARGASVDGGSPFAKRGQAPAVGLGGGHGQGGQEASSSSSHDDDNKRGLTTQRKKSDEEKRDEERRKLVDKQTNQDELKKVALILTQDWPKVIAGIDSKLKGSLNIDTGIGCHRIVDVFCSETKLQVMTLMFILEEYVQRKAMLAVNANEDTLVRFLHESQSAITSFEAFRLFVEEQKLSNVRARALMTTVKKDPRGARGTSMDPRGAGRLEGDQEGAEVRRAARAEREAEAAAAEERERISRAAFRAAANKDPDAESTDDASVFTDFDGAIGARKGTEYSYLKMVTESRTLVVTLKDKLMQGMKRFDVSFKYQEDRIGDARAQLVKMLNWLTSQATIY